jgi:leucyl aminopeptidase (aminopeptidase T)
VLVYVSQDIVPDEPVDICVAVINGQELVVVSTSIDASKLAELVERHAGDDLKSRLHLAKLRF